MKMSVLFVGGTAEQCIASAILQQRGVNCNVIGACRELGAPWVGVPITALCDCSNAGADPSDVLPAGLSTIFTELSWTETEKHKLAPLGYECTTELLPLNSPLILMSSVANMGEYYRFIFLEEPLSLCNGQISQASTSIASLMRSGAYSITQRRNIIRLLKVMEQYIKTFHLSYLEFTDREDADVKYLAMPDEVLALRKFEEDNVQIVVIGEYFKIPQAFFSQLLCVPVKSLISLTFTDLLKGVVGLYQSLHGTRSRSVLEYGFSDIPQAFIRVLFCQGGLGIPKCSTEIAPSGLLIKPAAGDIVEIKPSIIYIADASLLAPVIQVLFILRDSNDVLVSNLRAHVDSAESESSAANTAHMPVNFVCILSSRIAIVRIGEGSHLRRGFLSVTICCSCIEDGESVTVTARSMQELVRAELPQFMGISTQQFRDAECAVFATHYSQHESIRQSCLFTDKQVTDLERQYTVKRHSDLFTGEASACSVPAILTGATTLIKDVLGDSVEGASDWVTDLRRTTRINACKQLFHRPREYKAEIDFDKVANP